MTPKQEARNRSGSRRDFRQIGLIVLYASLFALASLLADEGMVLAASTTFTDPPPVHAAASADTAGAPGAGGCEEVEDSQPHDLADKAGQMPEDFDCNPRGRPQAQGFDVCEAGIMPWSATTPDRSTTGTRERVIRGSLRLFQCDSPVGVPPQGHRACASDLGVAAPRVETDCAAAPEVDAPDPAPAADDAAGRAARPTTPPTDTPEIGVSSGGRQEADLWLLLLVVFGLGLLVATRRASRR